MGVMLLLTGTFEDFYIATKGDIPASILDGVIVKRIRLDGELQFSSYWVGDIKSEIQKNVYREIFHRLNYLYPKDIKADIQVNRIPLPSIYTVKYDCVLSKPYLNMDIISPFDYGEVIHVEDEGPCLLLDKTVSLVDFDEAWLHKMYNLGD